MGYSVSKTLVVKGATSLIKMALNIMTFDITTLRITILNIMSEIATLHITVYYFNSVLSF